MHAEREQQQQQPAATSSSPQHAPLDVEIGVASLSELALFERWAAREGWCPGHGA
jgi:hypothetical protein